MIIGDADDDVNYVLGEGTICVEEKDLFIDGSEQRIRTDVLNDDQTHLEEIDARTLMDTQLHGDVAESTPAVVEDESHDSS